MILILLLSIEQWIVAANERPDRRVVVPTSVASAAMPITTS
jgi:hypothetical protein